MLDHVDQPPAAHRVKRGKLAQQVGAHIKRHRKAHGVTLLMLAQRCGTTPQTMQRLESANMTISLDWVEAIAKALGVEPWELLESGVIGKTNDKAIEAQIELAAVRAAVRQLCRLVNEIVPDRMAEEREGQ